MRHSYYLLIVVEYNALKKDRHILLHLDMFHLNCIEIENIRNFLFFAKISDNKVGRADFFSSYEFYGQTNFVNKS
jgi:hypothetical protein